MGFEQAAGPSFPRAQGSATPPVTIGGGSVREHAAATHASGGQDFQFAGRMIAPQNVKRERTESISSVSSNLVCGTSSALICRSFLDLNHT